MRKSKDNVRTKSKTVGSDCNYIKSRSKKTKTLQKALSNLCDSDSSSGEDVRPFFLKSWNDTSNKNSSDETSDKTTDKKKSVGSKKEGETNSDKQKAVEKNQKVYSDSKDRGKSEKCAEGKKENCDMSEINKKNTEIESKICLERSDMINGERSLHFKNGALRIFNTFKEMCTKFELKLDHTRSLYSKNLSQQSVKDIIQKSESIVNSIRMELDSKEEELAKLYKEWCDNCNTEITTHKDNSVDEVEALKEAEGSEKLREKPKILDGTLLGSESDEIFSDNDVSVTTDNVEENEEIETTTEREILNTADAVSSKTSCDKQDDTLCKKQKEDDGAEISSSNEIVDKDLPEKESNENQGSSDTECETQSEDVNPSSKAKKKRTVSDTILEDDSLNDEDSQKTEEEDEDSGERDEGTKKKAKSLDSSSSESSDSDVIIKTTSTSKRRKKRLPSEEISSSKTRKNSLDKPSSNTGDKLKMRPCVVLKRLSKSMLKKYKRKIRKSLDDLEDKEIRSLVNLDRLQQNVNCKSDSSQTPACKKYKKTSTKHAQDDSKDEENEDSDNLDDNFDSEKDSSIDNAPPAIQTNEELLEEANAAAKRLLLNSSESDIRDPESAIESNDSGDGETEGSGKKVAKKSAKKAKKVETEEDKIDKGNDKWKRNKLLTSKLFSDEDTSEGEWLARQEKLRENEEKNTDSSTANAEDFKPKARVRRRIMKSDSDKDMNNSDSDSNSGNRSDATNGSSNDSTIGKQQKRRKRKPHKSSDTDSSVTDKKSKPKRKRIKNNCSDSSSDDDNGDQMTNSQGTPGKKGRKNIRKVMKDKQVASDTKQAAKEEEERLKRIAERQKLYNEMYEARVAGEQKLDKLVLDFDPETKEDLVTVHENLVKRLKPHQAEGIKFMWDACFESLERIKNSAGSGCIIAHCMGLGKTLQIISLIHTLLTHEQTGVRTVMIACPLSTVLNWMNEFSLWLKGIDDDIEVYEMTKLKRIIDRKYQLERWQRTGGVIVIGYDMFRNLSGQNSKIKKTVRETIAKCLIDPGPDVIVCDEGHILKNEDSALSKSINRVKTMRRIVLTGTPLQNNLVEYHCMVQFVKPSLLGTKKEFSNRFVNPITNGQFDDSTEHDVKVMKKRAYVLHKMLKGCVQRFDYSVLTPILPPKQEYVIFVSLTEVQINMYRYYLENFASPTRNSGGSLFADFQAMQRIWTHPVIVRVNAEKMNEKNSSASDSEGSLRDFVVDDSESSETPSTSDSDSDDDVKHLETKADTKYTRSKADANDSQDETHMETEESEKKDEDWWVQFTKPEDFEDLRVSAKLVLLFGILKECEQIGDKVLVFSQSLYSLNLIENFLQKIDNQDEDGQNSEYLGGHTGCWTLGLDYFRLDGQSSAENRNAWCKLFNKPSNTRARLFLISTRAGGLGINLTAANRVIIFDASWNPSHDVQSIFRIYRFGQKKPCYVYRFLAAATMEEKIYNRQVTKLSLSCRVVDKQQIERHYSNTDLSELYKFEPNVSGDKRTLNVPKDRLLAEILLKYRNYVENYHEHDSLLENKAEEELNDEERKQAWLEYEEEKKGKPAQIPIYPVAGTFPNYAMFNQSNMLSTFNMSPDYEKLKELLQKDYPNATPEAQQMMTARVFTDMYNYWEQQTYHNSTSRLTGQGAVPTTVTMRSQAPIMTQILQNKNVSRQTKDYDTPEIIITSSDDVVEVPTTTVVSKNKNQEE